MRLNLILLVLIVFNLGFYRAQQTPVSSLYNYNLYMVNPGELGFSTRSKVNLVHRQQWSGFEGAPVTTWLTAEHKLNKEMGIGINFCTDRVSFLDRMQASAGYGYKINVDDKSYVSFGLSLGFIQTKINLNQVIGDVTDNLLLSNSISGMVFDAQFGVAYEFKNKLRAGFALPQMLNQKMGFNNGIEGTYDLTKHTVLYASYILDMSDASHFIPTLAMRTYRGGAMQFDLIGTIKFQENFWVGVGLRQEAGIMFNIGGQIKDIVALTYNYGLVNSGFSYQTGGTHELMVTYKLKKKTAPKSNESTEAPGAIEVTPAEEDNK